MPWQVLNAAFLAKGHFGVKSTAVGEIEGWTYIKGDGVEC